MHPYYKKIIRGRLNKACQVPLQSSILPLNPLSSYLSFVGVPD
jgi:hypothetical protein